MSRQAKIIIFGVILAYSIYSHQNDSSIFDWATETRETNKRKGDELINRQKETQNSDKNKLPDLKTDLPFIFPQPKNGFSPYNAYFGKGIYDNSTGNVFIIKNSTLQRQFIILQLNLIWDMHTQVL